MSPRAKYNNRTDRQAQQSFSQVLLERQSNKPLIVYLPVEVDGTQTATYVFLNTYWEMLGQISLEEKNISNRLQAESCKFG